MGDYQDGESCYEGVYKGVEITIYPYDDLNESYVVYIEHFDTFTLDSTEECIKQAHELIDLILSKQVSL